MIRPSRLIPIELFVGHEVNPLRRLISADFFQLL
jgi:hypothetical protein